MIDELIYGIIPRENIEKRANAPPVNILKSPNKLLLEALKNWDSATGLTPGVVICTPILNTINIKRV
jgi:hypothetical protein